ncbi:hypothetical protein BAL199_15117 [alpha proteobacterium BAL199]|jgi:hypothetical protein|nr:hypothetical protein BAL199_15117 [alpha proteobacterium BAL199]
MTLAATAGAGRLRAMATRPTAPGYVDGSPRHRLTALAAVYAILAQILLGTLAAAFGPAAVAGDRSALAQLAELCTPDGLVRIAYRDGDDTSGGTSERVAPKCPFCLGGGSAPTLAPSGTWTLDPPSQTAQADWLETDSAGRSANHFTEVRPRAPPPIV